MHGESAELKTEVTRIAKQHGIITPYTSYLILEDQTSVANFNRTTNQAAPTQIFEEKFRSDDNIQILHDYSGSMKKEHAGKTAVESSQKQQRMNNASNLSGASYSRDISSSDKSEEEGLLNYKDKNGNNQNIASQNKMINGRAFYNNGLQWVDIKTENQKVKLTTIKLKFASDEYFKFQQSNMAASQYLSLGNNVKFVYNGNIIEVYE